MIQTRQTNIDKYLYLSSVKAQNIDLFYRLLMDNIRDLMPLVYTPTIGDVCLQYSTLYTRPEALYISIKQRKSIRTMLRNWPCPNPEICVVTDGSRILGLGDLGVNGVGISVSHFLNYKHQNLGFGLSREFFDDSMITHHSLMSFFSFRLASWHCILLLLAYTRTRPYPSF